VTDERPGEQEGIKPLNDDTQGHAGRFRPLAPDADESAQPGEQKIYRPGRVTDESDTEGHAGKIRPATEGTDEPPSDEADAEGHAAKVRPFTPDAERPAQPGEQKLARPGRVTDESDTEG
jgi:hypothetical protein